MNKNANPIESIIDFAWASGADRFWVNNAKDEIKKLRQEILELKQKMEDNLSFPVAWARINERGDLFDLNLRHNPYIDPKTLIPLYRKTNE